VPRACCHIVDLYTLHPIVEKYTYMVQKASQLQKSMILLSAEVSQILFFRISNRHLVPRYHGSQIPVQPAAWSDTEYSTSQPCVLVGRRQNTTSEPEVGIRNAYRESLLLSEQFQRQLVTTAAYHHTNHTPFIQKCCCGVVPTPLLCSGWHLSSSHILLFGSSGMSPSHSPTLATQIDGDSLERNV
jgi:hypothetical protein